MQGAVLGKKHSKVIEYGIEILRVFFFFFSFVKCRLLEGFFLALRLTHKIGYLKVKKKKIKLKLNATIFPSNLKFQRNLMPGAEGLYRNPSPAV